MKSIIICEKPSVAREFCKVLGVKDVKDGYLENDDYIITWCFGHLVSLSYPEVYDESLKKWSLEPLPFLPEKYLYEVIKDSGVKKQFKTIKELYHRKDVGTLLMAGDPGREGIYIQYLVRQEAGLSSGIEEKVIWIDSQTEDEIRKGIRNAKPRSSYDTLAMSGYMRAIEDYAFGINLSRAISLKYAGIIYASLGRKREAIPVGRVMSCVLGMIVSKEREIRNFIETPFYRVVLCMNNSIEAEFKAVDGSKYEGSPLLYRENGFKEEQDAQALIQSINDEDYVVKNIFTKEKEHKAPKLFNLAELQNECSKIFKISPDQTLAIAQSLYEKKMTTYPRTDARVLSTAIAKEIDKNVNGLSVLDKYEPFVNEVISFGPVTKIENSTYTDDSKVTDHYAIIPTGDVGAYDTLKQTERAVYDHIVKRFLSIFYPPAIKETVYMQIDNQTEHFYMQTTITKNPSYMKFYESDEKKNVAIFKLIQTFQIGDKVKDKVACLNTELREGKTSPPKRYTSGSIILAMENAGTLIEEEELREKIKGTGIGTSATRADTIKKLVDKEHIDLNKKTQILTPTNLGEMIYEVLKLNVPNVLSPKMTASWETGLEQIVEGKIKKSQYENTMNGFIRDAIQKIKTIDRIDELKTNIKPFVATDLVEMHLLKGKCPKCGGDITTTRSGGYGCKNYKKEGGCNFYIGEICGYKLKESEVEELLSDGKVGPFSKFVSKNKKKFSASLALEQNKDIDENAAEPEKCTGRLRFVFEEEKFEETELLCPKCKSEKLGKSERRFHCSCGYSMYRKIANKKITDMQIEKLIQGEVVKITGLKTKRGVTYSKEIRADEDGKLIFIQSQ